MVIVRPAMHYRIELSNSRKGFARVNLPGRVIEVEAGEHIGPVWQVRLTELSAAGQPNTEARALTVCADSANDAVWRVARAAVRAVSELTGSPIEGELTADTGNPQTI
jgi:hypothetical protein